MTIQYTGIPASAAWQIGIAFGAITASASAWACAPVSTNRLVSQPQPAATYADALTRWATLQQADDHTIHPLARSRLLTHGARMEHVAILLHGVTNCPQQFLALGMALFDQGYNVLIPRMPRNGLADRHTDELKHLRAPELCRFTDAVVDIAAGLGAQITIVGLSAGGNLAAWAAQQRSDIHRAVVIAPSFGILRMRQWQHTLVRNVFSRLPAITYLDAPDIVQCKPQHTYLRNNSRAIGEILRLGAATDRAARTAPPAARTIVVVTNAADTVVDNRVTERFLAHWRRNGYAGISTYTFGAALELPHDLIDPAQPDGRVDVVYPVLLQLMERG